jgi:uncharacterized protein (UPF0276 family)
MNTLFPNLGFGLGLRAPHYEEILRDRPKQVGWFEIISENFLDAHEGYWEFLAELRQDYPFALHGVSMSIGGSDPINEDYVRKLKRLIDFIEPAWVSDHLCFTGVHSHNTHDLLPIPYTKDSLRHVISRIDTMQERLGRRLVFENPSTYLEFQQSDIPEAEFLRALAQATGCGLLLDVNNVYVTCFNHGLDPHGYIDCVGDCSVAQFHLAGHQNNGTHIIDTHDAPVIDSVWDLYAETIAKTGFRSTMIEWDDKIPSLATLIAELEKARTIATLYADPVQETPNVLQHSA